MAEKKYEKNFMIEPFGKVMHGPGIKVPPGTPIDIPYWIGIGQEEPEAWGFPLSMVLRPIWKPRVMFEGKPHTHHVSEVLYFIGGDPMNFKEFGAECELMIDGEKYLINSTTFVHIPPEVPHCPLTFKKVDKPIMFGHIMFAPMFECTIK
jgi:mannose-6-phosphate isomerase-like protein (cupin superfamily)